MFKGEWKKTCVSEKSFYKYFQEPVLFNSPHYLVILIFFSAEKNSEHNLELTDKIYSDEDQNKKKNQSVN